MWCLDCEKEVYDSESEAASGILIPLRTHFTTSDRYSPRKITTNKKKGLTGLSNLGNTCFMSSAVQCITHIKSVSRYFRKLFNSNLQSIDDKLALEFKHLAEQLWKSNQTSLSPRKFLSALHKAAPFFQGLGQHDSQEFLKIFLDKMHETTKHEQEYQKFTSIISDTFKSDIKSKVTCLECRSIFSKVEEYFDIPLTIPSDSERQQYQQYSSEVLSPIERIQQETEKRSIWRNISKIFSSDSSYVKLYECLLNYCLPEKLTDQDMFYCEKCKKKCESQREMKIVNPPNVLTLIIKRFKFSRVGSKILTYVQFPIELDLRYFLEKPRNCTYQLTGIIQHIGALGGGHYIAYCQNSQDFNWYEFNDSIVTEVSEREVLEKEAYILFYHKTMDEIRNKLIELEPYAYIPSYWLNKYLTLANPGPIYQKYLLCKHRNLWPFYKLSEFTRISYDKYHKLIEAFGIDDNVLRSIQECKVCEEQIRELSSRINQEIELVKELEAIKKFEGPWYIVSTKWITKWKRFLSLSSSINLFPGPVNNSCLLSDQELRPDLKKGTDYKGVSRHVWEALMVLYDGGPAITRGRLDIYSPFVEVPEYSSPSLSSNQLSRLENIKNKGLVN